MTRVHCCPVFSFRCMIQQYCSTCSVYGTAVLQYLLQVPQYCMSAALGYIVAGLSPIHNLLPSPTPSMNRSRFVNIEITAPYNSPLLKLVADHRLWLASIAHMGRSPPCLQCAPYFVSNNPKRCTSVKRAHNVTLTAKEARQPLSYRPLIGGQGTLLFCSVTWE